MGLIKAAIGATGSTLADQWKEFFYCEAMDKETLAVKGQKIIGPRSSNTKGSDNVISQGSGIVVADGQCMMIVEQGRIVEVCSEPGEYIFDKSSEPSIFASNLGEGIRQIFNTIGRRFTFGGDTAKDQRVYYFNLKELMDNKFGTANPIPFRVLDQNIGLDIDVAVRCNGVYSYKIANPILFYVNVCGNFADVYKRSELDTQLKTEFVAALQPAFGKLSAMGLRPYALMNHTEEMQEAMAFALREKWAELRGLKLVSVALGSVTLPEEDAQLIKESQRLGMLRNTNMAAATLVGAQADAMKAAANNSAGAMTGFMGMGMAMNQTNQSMVQGLYQMNPQGSNEPQPQGQVAEQVGEWHCSCGVTNQGKFCSECGKKKEDVLGKVCHHCGWRAKEGSPKFCPECGQPFSS